MRRIQVQVCDDHLEIIGKTRPINAIVELIWNALDAEATIVRVNFIENELTGLEYIEITDNGHGLKYEEAIVSFSSLGGSWKKEKTITPREKRILHGKYGKGRFRAFSLGNSVTWESKYFEGDNLLSYKILASGNNLTEFILTEPEISQQKVDSTGMKVLISDLTDGVNYLRGVNAIAEITEIFAPYLMQYPNVKIYYDSVLIDPLTARIEANNYQIDRLVIPSGKTINGTLTIVEWASPGKRGLFFCDEHGFARFSPLPKLYFRGFSYTAYFKSEYVKVLDQQGLLQLEELSEDVRFLIEICRKKLREHFILREGEKGKRLVQEWKDEGIYPIPNDSDLLSEDQKIEIKIFETYATHLFHIVKELNDSPKVIRELLLKLIYTLVKENSIQLAHILNEIAKIPEEKETELKMLEEERQGCGKTSI
ncbi:MAG: ATP-binding protein [Candidatus Hydrogenedentes bacterium]|nr:ATP-binding protein [Candidatus Hydrogenedentota bacterium]